LWPTERPPDDLRVVLAFELGGGEGQFVLCEYTGEDGTQWVRAGVINNPSGMRKISVVGPKDQLEQQSGLEDAPVFAMVFMQQFWGGSDGSVVLGWVKLRGPVCPWSDAHGSL